MAGFPINLNGPPKAPMMDPNAPRPKYVKPAMRATPPIKSAYPLPVTEFQWEYWFNYFYDEIADRERQKAYFFRVSPADGVYRRDADIDLAEKTKLLKEMMDLGFVAFPEQRISANDMFESMRTKFGVGGHHLQNQNVKVMFRGDGRNPKTIKSHGGTIPQARVAGLSASRGFNNLWHPWNDAICAGRGYFRRNNADNCLFTVISVTPEFLVATKFPLLSDLRATMPKSVGKVEVDAETIAGPDGSMIAARQAKFSSKTRLLPCSRTNIYAVKVKKGWDTEQMQGTSAFPERALHHVNWEDHYTVLPIIRIHFSDDPNSGHLIVVEDVKWLQSDALLRLRLGDAGLKALRDFLGRMRVQGELRGGSGGIVYEPPGIRAAIKITRISKFSW